MTNRGFDIEEYFVLMGVKLNTLLFPKEELTPKGLDALLFSLSINNLMLLTKQKQYCGHVQKHFNNIF